MSCGHQAMSTSLTISPMNSQHFCHALTFCCTQFVFRCMLCVSVPATLQVAHLMLPYKRPHRKQFLEHCRRLGGLTVEQKEIVTWEPEFDNRMENDEEWVTWLITVRKSEPQA
ncbi:unnamed protein product [Polarella glacialis]|uniref:Uncharacterized protein n=1 Tax=Polarella glacialis TaxID=89957 RepID=A0A813IW99_POLGL|nr:unnamed protein product [Polarella glacialis]